MCDYSAKGAITRDAVVGDVLITAYISEHTIGLVSPDKCLVAVCLKPGTRVTVSFIEDKLREEIGLWDVVAIATFRQRFIPGHTLGYLRDGLYFENADPDWLSDEGDRVVLLCELGNVTVTVEWIPGENAISAGTETVVERELVDA